MKEWGSEPNPFSEAERIFDKITHDYSNGTTPPDPRGDVVEFFKSKLVYAEALGDDPVAKSFKDEEVGICTEVLSEIEKGYWGYANLELKRLSGALGKDDDEGLRNASVALAKLADRVLEDPKQ